MWPWRGRVVGCGWRASEAPDHGRREDLGLDPVALGLADLLQDRLARAAHLRLLVVVELQEAVEPLDDLHSGLDRGGFDRDIGEPVDGDPGRDLDEDGSLPADGEEALRHRPQEGRVLLLERVEEDVASEVDHGSVLPPLGRLAPGERLDRPDGRDRRHVDVALLAPQVDAPERPRHPDVHNVDLRRLLGLVRREGRVARGLDLQDVERLAGHEHHPQPVAVDELHLEGVDVADDLRGEDSRLDPVRLVQRKGGEDGGAGLPDLGLRGAVDLEHPVEPLDDLHARAHVGRLHGDVGDAVDLDAGGDLHDQGRLVGNREKAPGDRADVGRELRLHRIEIDEAPQVRHQVAPLASLPEGDAIPLASLTIFTPTEAPIRVAPAAMSFCASSADRIPPDAFTPSLRSTACAMSSTSRAVAPPVENPVEVFTNSARAFRAATQPATFSSSVRSDVSRITLRIAPPSWAVSATARMSSSTVRRSPDLSAPIAITMSISLAPSRMARRASSAFISLGMAPSGNPTTVQTTEELPARRAAQRLTKTGLTHTDAKPNWAASSQSWSMSEYVASARRRVWSMKRARSLGTSPTPGAADTRHPGPTHAIIERTVSGQRVTQCPPAGHSLAPAAAHPAHVDG